METLRKLQLVQYMILKDVAKLCDENNLKYYLVGGTLLGAIRHGGSIPWDDDIDIAMPREDYDKIQDIIEKNYSDKYKVQSPLNDKNYTRQILKVRLKGTKQLEKNMIGIEASNEIYIDIFPLDKSKYNSGVIVALKGKMIRILFAYNTMRCGKKDDMTNFKRMIRKMCTWITYLVPRKFVNWCFEKICTLDQNKECKYITSFLSGLGWRKQMMLKEVYGEGVKVKYESSYFRAPKEYDVLLQSLYGDYMTPPPFDERNSGHYIAQIDFGKYGDMYEYKNSNK